MYEDQLRRARDYMTERARQPTIEDRIKRLEEVADRILARLESMSTGEKP